MLPKYLEQTPRGLLPAPLVT